MTDKSGKLAYDSYARAQGLDTRSWEELPEEQQFAWSLVSDEADRQANQADVAELLDTEASPVGAVDDPITDADHGPRQENGEPDEDPLGNH